VLAALIVRGCLGKARASGESAFAAAIYARYKFRKPTRDERTRDFPAGMAEPKKTTEALDSPEGRRDRRTAIVLLVFAWLLYGAFEQSPFNLQGAVLEALVERGRLSFARGQMKDIMFENFDTNTPSFRLLFNVFPYEGRYHVNHAPGQFLLAAPWYAALVKLGWRFETHERLVWRILVWTLTAPLGAAAVASIFLLGRGWGMSWSGTLLSSLAFGFCSPWWPSSGVLYHDHLAVSLVLLGAAMWSWRSAPRRVVAIAKPVASGFLFAFAVVTTYLIAPIVALILAFIVRSRPSRRALALLACGFLPIAAILPVVNVIHFGSLFATGYSAGGFESNYPSLLDLANAWEKTRFYLWDSEYGLLWLFPAFALGAAGLLWNPPFEPSVKRMLLTLAAAHFLFIISMQHHGSVGWGMGRFFLPLYPILAFGLPAFGDLPEWKGHSARALMFSSCLYSALFALAGSWYGIQGVMEPGVPSLKLQLMVEYYPLQSRLIWLCALAGVVAESVYYACFRNPASAPVSSLSGRRVPFRPKSRAGAKVARRRKR